MEDSGYVMYNGEFEKFIKQIVKENRYQLSIRKDAVDHILNLMRDLYYNLKDIPDEELYETLETILGKDPNELNQSLYDYLVGRLKVKNDKYDRIHILELLTEDLIGSAGVITSNNKKKRITKQFIDDAINNDIQLQNLFIFKKKFVVNLDDKDVFLLEFTKKNTIRDIKNPLFGYLSSNKLDYKDYEIRLFINENTKVPVFDTYKYDETTLESVWNQIENPKIFLISKGDNNEQWRQKYIEKHGDNYLDFKPKDMSWQKYYENTPYNLYRERKSVRGYVSKTKLNDEDQLVVSGLYVPRKNKSVYTVIKKGTGFLPYENVNKEFKIELPLYTNAVKLDKYWNENYKNKILPGKIDASYGKIGSLYQYVIVEYKLYY